VADNRIDIQRPQRWDVPFWQEGSLGARRREMTEKDVDRILTVPPFSRIDPKKFPASTPYRGVLLNDTRIRNFSKGDIAVREGDYGNSAFFILSGSVEVVLERLDQSLIGRRAPQRKNFFSALAQLWRNPSQPEVRSRRKLARAGQPVPSWERDAPTNVFLEDVSVIIQGKATATLRPGEFFGEIAALGRTPRTSTIFAERRCELLEIRWQGLRELRLRSSEVKDHIEGLYRSRSLKTHLRETPMFRHLGDGDLARVAEATEFQSHGEFEWHASYNRVAELSQAERLQMEPVVAREGDYPNGIFLVRSGFARLSETYNHAERTISYLGRGQSFGFEEVAHNWRHKEQIPFQHTLRAVGHLDALFVPTLVIEQYVLPTLKEPDFPDPCVPKAAGQLFERRSGPLKQIGPETLEFLVEKRFINGTATMLVDLDRCTRCDDCIRACAATHENNPRFIRHGPVQGRTMIANACMHCLDPVCMLGCPTGAIHRDSRHRQVLINDLTCIGCGLCANSCPYGNIQMVYPRDAKGKLFYDQFTHSPIQKAAKCDLCADQITGPACAHACPHDALLRVDMRDLETLSKWFNR